MRQPLLQKASSQSATICAHSERGDLYHSMRPSGNGRQQRKLSELAALTARDGWSAGPFFLALPGKKKDLSRSPFSRCAYRLSAGPNRKTSAIDETSMQAHLSQLRSHCDLLTKSSKCQSSPLTRVRDRGGVRLWRSRIITHWRDETLIPWKTWKFPVMQLGFVNAGTWLTRKKNTFKGPGCKFLPDLQFLYL